MLDSSTTHHLIGDSYNLHSYILYIGFEIVIISNDNTLPIHHVGSNSMHLNKHVFYLSKVIHTPTMSSNLLYVHQFCSDNNVSVEFYGNSFAI